MIYKCIYKMISHLYICTYDIHIYRVYTYLYSYIYIYMCVYIYIQHINICMSVYIHKLEYIYILHTDIYVLYI